MQKTKDHIELLWNKFLSDEATKAELKVLFEYMETASADDPDWDFIKEGFLKEDMHKEGFVPMDADQKAALLRNWESRTVPRISVFRRAWFRYAAILLLIAGTAAYLYTHTSSSWKDPNVTKTTATPKPQDILPGSDKAVLTLAGGRQVQLDASADPLLAEKGITNRNALLHYSGAPAPAEMNTLTTPNGGQYRLQLADGTIVWLNAASSITYPTVFNEKDRQVTITGEAYFEVTTDAQKPFIVNTPSDQIQVLGTAFNINAYANEDAVKTTLVNGSVKIAGTLLHPGQAFTKGRVLDANVDQDLAWKNGFIHFAGKPIPQVMRELARWYDIDVVYEQGVPNVKLGGKVSRNVSLAGMISSLEAVELHVKLEGRKLIVLSK